MREGSGRRFHAKDSLVISLLSAEGETVIVL